MPSSKREIGIMLVDSHEVMRVGVKFLFCNHNGLQVVAETDCFSEALEKVSQCKPDVILLDCFLTDGNCVEKIPDLLRLCPKSKILLFTSSQDEQFQLYTLRLGISGILQKNCSAELLIRAIEKVSEGQVWFDRNLTQLFLQSKVEDYSPHLNNLISKLSSKENTIVCLASNGMLVKEISERLLVAEKTIRNQMSIIYSKLNIKNHVGLCLAFSKVDLCQSCSHKQNKCPKISPAKNRIQP